MTIGTRATRQWVLVAAASAGVAGFLLKATEPGDPLSAPPAAVGTAPGAPTPATADAGGAPTRPAEAPGEPGKKRNKGGRFIARLPDAGSVLPPRPAGRDLWAGAEGEPSKGGRHRKRGAGARGRRREGRKSLEARAPGEEVRGGDTPRGGHADAAADSAGAKTPDPSDGPAASAELSFDSGDTAAYPLDAQVEVPDIGQIASAAGTVSLWLQPHWEEGNQDDATLVQIGDRLQLVKNVNYLRLEFVDQGGLGGLGVPITAWQPGEWHRVTATWSAGGLALYVDGQFVSQTVHDHPVDLLPDAKLYIGSDFPLGRPIAPGTIGRVDVRGRPLTPAEVATDYNGVALGY
jgi:hypothetical protein